MKKICLAIAFVLCAAGICAAQNTLYFPQFVDGRPDANTVAWGSVLFLTNTAATGSPLANVTVTLINNNGTPMNLPLTDENGNAQSNTFQLGGGQTRYLFSPSNGHPLTPLSQGFATATSNLPISGGLIFIEYAAGGGNPISEAGVPPVVTATSNLPISGGLIFIEYAAGGGNPISEAGVPPASLLTRQVVPAVVMTNPPQGNYGTNPGVAVANPGNSDATITFQLVGENGATVGASVVQVLGPNNHTAFFIPQLFPNAPATFFGAMRLTSDNPIVTTALYFTGPGLFATVPVFPLP
jgi:hypothetical protein